MKGNQAEYGVSMMCQVLGVSPSGYYAWAKRPPSARSLADAVLGGLVFSGVVLLAGYALRGAWRWTWLLPAFVLLTLPSTLSLAYPYENPSFNRAEPAIPVVFLVTALPLAFLCRSFAHRRGMERVACFALLHRRLRLLPSRTNCRGGSGRGHCSFCIIDHERLERLRGPYPGSKHIVHQSHPDCDFGVYIAIAQEVPEHSAVPPPAPIQTSSNVSEQVLINGETIEAEHSRLDQGGIPDLFDGDEASLARTENATTAFFDFTFTNPRRLRGVDVTTATMDVGLKVFLYSAQQAEPTVLSKEFRKLPLDPTVRLDFGGSKDVKRVRLEIANLNGGDGHIHVREIRWR